MNPGKDPAGEAKAELRRLSGPEAPATRIPQREQQQVAALLQAIASEISQSDQRQSHALAELRARIETMTERQPASETVQAPDTNAAQAKPEPAKKPMMALPDLRAETPDSLRPALRAPEPVSTASARLEPKAQPAQAFTPRPSSAAPSLDNVYAAVAKSYADAASQRGTGEPAMSTRAYTTRRAPVAEPLDADGGSDFLDLSALAEPHLPAKPLRRPQALVAPEEVVATEPSRPAVAASLSVGQSIADLARRVAETEMKVDVALDNRHAGEAVAAINAHVDALRSELEKLTVEHERISAEMTKVSTDVRSLSDAAGRIGPMGDTLEHLNQAILTLRQDMPGYAATVAEQTAAQISTKLPAGGENTELAEKLAIVQSLLLAQSRDHLEADGRSFGALESIRGLVENLHSRIDALETGETEPQATATFRPAAPPSPVTTRFAPATYAEPVFEDQRPEADADAGEPDIADPQPMSREELIASARRAAAAASMAQRTAGRAEEAKAQPFNPRGLAPPRAEAAKTERLGSRAIMSVAMVALLAAGLGMVYAKFSHKPSPAVAIERAALPPMPDDTADLSLGGHTAAAADAKDTSRPADQSKTAAAPAAKSANMSDEPGVAPANASEMTQTSTAAKPAVVAALTPPQSPSYDLPAAIAPLSARTAALGGDPAAAYAIGERYISGKDVPRDASKARHWYEQSAQAGYPLAEFRLGVLLEKGDDGVTADRTQALGWYRKAADHGNVQAMHNLAVLYAAQSGGTPDYPSAAKWFEQAANFGMKDSQFNLAILYQNGLGVPKDPAAAYKWFAIGAARGDAEAAKQRDELRNSVPAAALAKMDAQVAAWHAKLPDHRANTGEVPGMGGDATQTNSTTLMTPTASSEVGDVQGMLVKLGYDPGTLDGTMTAQTREAIHSFEQRSGLPLDGEISDALMAKLKGLAG